MFPIQDVTDAELIFSANISRLMPKYEEIPSEFKRFGATKWERIADLWFCRGLHGAQFVVKSGIDEKRVMRHLSTIIQSYEPKHEHKIAAVAYLLSEWFEDIVMHSPS